uniref:EGF-like calcium-binding domain-containing protein n=1 Tax=Fagus sylvatica TaxID=28930 RepID=A0A2N9EI63_FAGSY
MASSKLMAFIAMLVVLLPMLALGSNDTSPLDDFLGKVCEQVECGKGNCTVDTSYPLGFKCECERDWRRDDDGDDDLSFLPCVIPNCTLKYSGCQPAPPPVPERENPRNISAFDRTLGSDCASLGIKVSNSTSSGDGSGTGQATSFLPGKFHWIAILMVSFGLVLWK